MVAQEYEQHKGTDHIGRTRDAIAARIIADRLGIAPGDVTADLRWHFAVGFLDEGCTSVLWLRDYVRPAPEAEWPNRLPDLITEGSDER